MVASAFGSALFHPAAATFLLAFLYGPRNLELLFLALAGSASTERTRWESWPRRSASRGGPVS